MPAQQPGVERHEVDPLLGLFTDNLQQQIRVHHRHVALKA
ncbi:MAG: hypothetical protein BWX70_03121 [Verrucomicrobia bacterium ADurb.Bin070]|nr:MAG: hypothetical protein BWX70_03121 [Verrucomicrobia bacterium ADurb.Bin070]